ncbi:TetR/AcrR family transcriptional regulator [Aquibacillus kalidii]|uniref:TetR/AcrR family transcriptional regulator n=1 Tax=Aquibacillus kalidii TaxID=2762597 RepID=UPI0016490AD7|nr:TetR/AcrR family transcriptional regulator [Aquibacillus kalidii]
MSPKVSKEHIEQRRNKIVDAAKHVFAEQGFENTTMKHVMEKASVSRGGLYQYFANKEDLFETILKEDLDSIVEENNNLLKRDINSYWDLLLLRMFGDSKQPSEEMDDLAPSKLEFFITGRNDRRRREYGEERYRNGLRIYTDVIKAGQACGEFSEKYDSEIVARSIVAHIDGLALEHAILPKHEVKLKQQSDMFLEYLKMALEIKKDKE